MKEQKFEPVFVISQGAMGRAARLLSKECHDTNGIPTYSSVDVADFLGIAPSLFLDWGGVDIPKMETASAAWRPYFNDFYLSEPHERQFVLFDTAEQQVSSLDFANLFKEVPGDSGIQMSPLDIYLSLTSLKEKMFTEDMDALKLLLLSPEKNRESIEKTAQLYARIRSFEALTRQRSQMSGFLGKRSNDSAFFQKFFATGYNTLLGDDYRDRLGISKGESVTHFLSHLGLETTRSAMVDTLNTLRAQGGDVFEVYEEKMGDTMRNFGVSSDQATAPYLEGEEREFSDASKKQLLTFPRLVARRESAVRVGKNSKIDLRN